MADTEFGNKLNAALRYGGTTAGTAFTFLAVLSLVTPDQLVELKAQIDILNQSLVTAYGALTKMWIILGPVAIGILAKIGWSSSGVKALGAKLFNIASGPASPEAAEAQKTLIQATSAIAQDKTIPTSMQAKVALIDGAAAQPEVVGKINVTDPALVVATQSNQVQKAA